MSRDYNNYQVRVRQNAEGGPGPQAGFISPDVKILQGTPEELIVHANRRNGSLSRTPN